MKKRILGLLLVVCLMLALLPATVMADTPTTAKVLILSQYELAVTEGGTPVYLKNKEFDAYNKEDGSSTFKAWTQETATKDNWNVKFEWPKGDTPTVTLKDAKMDYYDNATETYAYLKKSDGSYISTENRNTSDLEKNGKTSKNMLVAAIFPAPNCQIDLKVVLEGDNFVETGSGFIFSNVAAKANEQEEKDEVYANQFFKNLTVTSVGEGKVVANGGGIGIMAKPGYNLTFENANIEISNVVHGSNACPLHVTNGNLTITGGNMKLSNTSNPAVYVTGDEDNTGNIVINGNVTAHHKLTSTSAVSTIYSKGGTITINGGEIVLTSDNASNLNAGKGVYIKGGNLNLTSPYYAIYAGVESLTQIDGGTLEITAANAFNIAPFTGDKVTGVVGANAENAEPYDKENYLKPWAKFSDDPTKLPAATATEEPSTAPTIAPTQAPTQATTAPATNGNAATTPNAQDKADTDNSTVLLIAAAALVLIAGAVVVVIVIKRKKA